MAEQDLTQMLGAAAAEAKQHGNFKDPAHNVLGNHKGLGDGRDTIVSKIDDGTGANLRLTMREIPGRNANGVNARDVIAIAPRHGPDNIYQRTGERLGRGPNETLPELDRFGDAQVGSGGKAHQRGPVLDANRAIAHAFDGQKRADRLAALNETEFGSRAASGSTKQATRTQDTPQRGQQLGHRRVSRAPGPSHHSASR